MLSKNNKKLLYEKQSPKKQKFAIKKFSVGVFSVLIGSLFALGGSQTSSSALADQVATNQVQKGNENVVENTAKEQNTYTLKQQSQKPAENTATQENQNEVQAQKQADNQSNPVVAPQKVTVVNATSESSQAVGVAKSVNQNGGEKTPLKTWNL